MAGLREELAEHILNGIDNTNGRTLGQWGRNREGRGGFSPPKLKIGGA